MRRIVQDQNPDDSVCKKINLSTFLAGQAVNTKEVDDGIWLVSFMDYDLGYLDLEKRTLQLLKITATYAETQKLKIDTSKTARLLYC